MSKHSDYVLISLNEEDSVIKNFEAWVNFVERKIIQNQSVYHGESKKNIVLTHASFKEDGILFSELPDDLNA